MRSREWTEIDDSSCESATIPSWRPGSGLTNGESIRDTCPSTGDAAQRAQQSDLDQAGPFATRSLPEKSLWASRHQSPGMDVKCDVSAGRFHQTEASTRQQKGHTDNRLRVRELPVGDTQMSPRSDPSENSSVHSNGWHELDSSEITAERRPHHHQRDKRRARSQKDNGRVDAKSRSWWPNMVAFGVLTLTMVALCRRDLMHQPRYCGIKTSHHASADERKATIN